ncbi:MAG TPA: hypothetical protein VHV08_15800 [Pirellulales bacterium]|nr:hypothetical protein [Pirellulales bacterium]
MACYRCPGQDYDIDRSVHLSRLAAFYPACRECAHRADVSLLISSKQRHWEEILRHAAPQPRFTSEALEVPAARDFDAALVRRFAAAVGVYLWQQRHGAGEPPQVLVGTSGPAANSELLAATCAALEWAGCHAVELGAATSASIACAAYHFQSDAAILICDAQGPTAQRGLKAWGHRGRPWSSPGELTAVHDLYVGEINRPRRHGGGLRRESVDKLYLAPLRPQLHALRPLRLVLDTTCQSVTRFLEQLVSQSGCEVLRPNARAAVARTRADRTCMSTRLERLGAQVVARKAHFGLWINGDGEACQLVDERGTTVAHHRLCQALAAYVRREKPGAMLVRPQGLLADVQPRPGESAARVVAAGGTRQAMFDAIDASDAVCGFGTDGEFWFAGEPTAPDALMALLLLLVIFSQSDRAVSSVLGQMD